MASLYLTSRNSPHRSVRGRCTLTAVSVVGVCAQTDVTDDDELRELLAQSLHRQHDGAAWRIGARASRILHIAQTASALGSRINQRRYKDSAQVMHSNVQCVRQEILPQHLIGFISMQKLIVVYDRFDSTRLPLSLSPTPSLLPFLPPPLPPSG